MLLIGSRAINHYLPGFRSNPADVDVIATALEVDHLEHDHKFVHQQHTDKGSVLLSPHGVIWDIELASLASISTQLQGWDQNILMVDNVFLGVPTLDQLYTLKMSHRYLKNSPHFMKTMLDIWTLRRAGAKIWDKDWLVERERQTYVYAHPNLTRSKDEFFRDDNISYVYDHDGLHEAVKLGDVPAYTRFSAAGQQVFSSRKLFDALPEIHKLQAVLEECYVLAVERSQVPFPGTDPNVSFKIALEKVCTSITSGWFREYAWENYFAALALYSPSYVERFNAARPSLPLAHLSLSAKKEN